MFKSGHKPDQKQLKFLGLWCGCPKTYNYNLVTPNPQQQPAATHAFHGQSAPNCAYTLELAKIIATTNQLIVLAIQQ